MSSLLTYVATGAAWCFCTACASLLGACCGNDKPSTVPPSVSSGRKRSVFLLVLALALALVFQYFVSPWLVDNQQYTGFISDNWLDGCQQFNSATLRESCSGNSGVYRVCASAVLFFILAGIAVALKPTANREAWPAKYVLFLFLCGVTAFVPNEPLFTEVFLNVGRVGGVLFIMLQQIIILDLAYQWNESWVARSDQADTEEYGSGRKWLIAILISCGIMFGASIGGIVVMLIHFSGCKTNDAFIYATIITIVLVTGAQLTSEEGNLLTSAAISLWATYLCYTAISKNPNEMCNPTVGENDTVNVALGVLITFVSLAWTGWSWTAEEKLSSQELQDPLVEDQKTDGPRRVEGVVTGYGTNNGAVEEDDEIEHPASKNPAFLSNSWKLNFMLACITCWMAMALTSWGEIRGDGQAANPQVGRTGMWVIIASQWFVMALYLWTLVAPRLFPDRDFS